MWRTLPSLCVCRREYAGAYHCVHADLLDIMLDNEIFPNTSRHGRHLGRCALEKDNPVALALHLHLYPHCWHALVWVVGKAHIAWERLPYHKHIQGVSTSRWRASSAECGPWPVLVHTSTICVCCLGNMWVGDCSCGYLSLLLLLACIQYSKAVFNDEVMWSQPINCIQCLCPNLTINSPDNQGEKPLQGAAGGMWVLKYVPSTCIQNSDWTSFLPCSSTEAHMAPVNVLSLNSIQCATVQQGTTTGHVEPTWAHIHQAFPNLKILFLSALCVWLWRELVQWVLMRCLWVSLPLLMPASCNHIRCTFGKETPRLPKLHCDLENHISWFNNVGISLAVEMEKQLASVRSTQSCIPGFGSLGDTPHSYSQACCSMTRTFGASTTTACKHPACCACPLNWRAAVTPKFSANSRQLFDSREYFTTRQSTWGWTTILGAATSRAFWKWYVRVRRVPFPVSTAKAFLVVPRKEPNCPTSLSCTSAQGRWCALRTETDGKSKNETGLQLALRTKGCLPPRFHFIWQPLPNSSDRPSHNQPSSLPGRNPKYISCNITILTYLLHPLHRHQTTEWQKLPLSTHLPEIDRLLAVGQLQAPVNAKGPRSLRRLYPSFKSLHGHQLAQLLRWDRDRVAYAHVVPQVKFYVRVHRQRRLWQPNHPEVQGVVCLVGGFGHHGQRCFALEHPNGKTLNWLQVNNPEAHAASALQASGAISERMVFTWVFTDPRESPRESPGSLILALIFAGVPPVTGTLAAPGPRLSRGPRGALRREDPATPQPPASWRTSCTSHARVCLPAVEREQKLQPDRPNWAKVRDIPDDASSESVSDATRLSMTSFHRYTTAKMSNLLLISPLWDPNQRGTGQSRGTEHPSRSPQDRNGAMACCDKT